MRIRISLALCVLALVNACTRKDGLTDFAGRYADAWSGQDADALAAFYSPGGSLTINGGTPSVGREAIATTARGFMTAFPDMKVLLDSVVAQGEEQATFYWTLIGTNTGPSGTGRPVRISGFEEWHFGSDHLIAESKGHYDIVDYQRQLAP